MISRRALLGTSAGAVVVAGVAVLGGRTDKLDDVARKLGVDPIRRPALSDEKLIRTAQRDQSVLLSSTRAVSTRHPSLSDTLALLIVNIEAHVEALGGMVRTADATPPASEVEALDSVITAHVEAAAQRTNESLEAVSSDFAQVLASIAVSLSQSIVALRVVRKGLS